MPFIRCGTNGFYFCHVPRTGGRSLVQALARSGCEIDYNAGRGKHPHAWAKEWISNFPGAPSIAVVREPIDRFVSAMSFEGRVADEKDLYQQVRMMRRLPQVQERHFAQQSAFITKDTRLYRYEDGYEMLLNDLIDFGYLKSIEIVGRINAGAVKIEPTLTERRLHLEKLRRFYRQDFALHRSVVNGSKLNQT